MRSRVSVAFRKSKYWLTPSDCLAKNSYKEEKCRAQVDALYDCCNVFYSKYGDEAKSVSCPKASLLRLKLKQRAEESTK